MIVSAKSSVGWRIGAQILDNYAPENTNGSATRSPSRHGSMWILSAIVMCLSVIAIEQPAIADGQAKLDVLSPSDDWLGGVPDNPSREWMIRFGGRLYDKWYEAIGASEFPNATHPSYPKDGEFEGPTTWRCKECHGWDYKGRDGAYGVGRHATGITGVREVEGTAVGDIRAILTDAKHGFDERQLPKVAMDALALFLAEGQHDASLYINAKTNEAYGDPERGRAFYQNICAACHGFDGRAINFAEGEDDEEGPIEFIGTIANTNPIETLHKIRNGQPGQPMPALGVLDIQDAVDILTYTQRLPKE